MKTKGGGNSLSNDQLFRPENIQLNVALNKADDVIRLLGDTLANNGYVVDGYTSACTEREQLYPTGLQLKSTGVALPHADTHYVKHSAIAVATLKEPVTFRQMGDPDAEVAVRVVFLLAPQKGEEQLAFLEGLVSFIQQSDRLAHLCSCQSPDEAAQLLEKHVFSKGDFT